VTLKSIISLANEISSTITENSLIGNSIRQNQDIIGYSVLTENDLSKLKVLRVTATDLIEFADSLFSIIGKNISDDVTINDVLSFIIKYQRDFSDVTTIIEQLSLSSAKIFTDVTTITDLSSLSTLKHFADSLSTTDAFSTLIKFNRSFSDLISFYDTDTSFNIKKQLTDQSTIIEQLTKVFSSTISDNFTSLDDRYFIFNKSELDDVTSTDDISLLVSFIRSFNDYYTNLDTLKYDLNKILSDSYSITDVLTRTALFQRELTDSISTFDVIDLTFAGLFIKSLEDSYNIFDDLNIAFNKQLADSISTVDELTKFIAIVKVDSYSIEELLAKNISKELQDSISTFDVIDLLFAGLFIKSLEDSYTTLDEFTTIVKYNRTFDIDYFTSTDNNYFDFLKTADDSISFNDSYNRVIDYNRELQDSLNFTDELILLLAGFIQKQLEDSYTTLDEFTRIAKYSRTFSELVEFTETAEKTYIKSITVDTFELLDTINKQIIKNFNDSYSIDSFGSLISQNYTIDNSYFLEDYVGESRTFT